MSIEMEEGCAKNRDIYAFQVDEVTNLSKGEAIEELLRNGLSSSLRVCGISGTLIALKDIGASRTYRRSFRGSRADMDILHRAIRWYMELQAVAQDQVIERCGMLVDRDGARPNPDKDRLPLLVEVDFGWQVAAGLLAIYGGDCVNLVVEDWDTLVQRLDEALERSPEPQEEQDE